MTTSPGAAADPAEAQPATPHRPAELAPILPVDGIRVGMKGYGLTVFHGTRVEPFNVEVVSVMRDFGPKQAVIWIRCPDERLQKTGPVQGMSGSPIYLWSDDEPQILGQGGRLIGAFAFGFGATKDCFAGVQPIDLMRQAAQRASDPNQAGPQADASGRAPAPTGLQMIRSLVNTNARRYPGATSGWRAQALVELLEPGAGLQRSSGGTETDDSEPDSASINPRGFAGARHARPLLLPLAVPSQAAADLLAPLLEPVGLSPAVWGGHAPSTEPTVAHATGTTATLGLATDPPPGAGAIVGKPPPGVDPATIEFEAGGVLGVPLAFGDVDLSAVGTVTEVWPDGRVLGFGHAMFGQGPTSMPMAAGYVHMMMPSLFTSFKLGGSGVIRGTLLRDENSAVVGLPIERFETAPVDVQVLYPGMAPQRYQYRVSNHRQIAPIIASMLVIQSLTAVTGLPVESTIRLNAEINFDDGLALKLESLLPDASDGDILMEILPAIAAISNNRHKPMHLRSMSVTAEVTPRRLVASIVSVRLDRQELAPGDTLKAYIGIQPYGHPTDHHTLELLIPEHLPEGQYELLVCDARNYLRVMMETHPHLLTTRNERELAVAVQSVLDVASDALYLVLQTSDTSVALGRQEMPRLPSSRRAMFESPTTTTTTLYHEWVEKTVPMGTVIEGSVPFSLAIQKGSDMP